MAGIFQRIRDRLFRKERSTDSGGPLHVLEDYNHKLFESTEKLAKRHIELNQVRAKLKAHADKLRGFLRKYDDQARKYYQSGQMELVETALKEKLQHKAELDRLNDSIQELDNHINGLKSHKERLQGQLQLYKIKREAIELRYDASKTELETKELQMGLSDTEIPDIDSAIKDAESEIQSIQVQLEATRELEADPGTAPHHLAADGDAGEAKIEEEIEQLKRELLGRRDGRHSDGS